MSMTRRKNMVLRYIMCIISIIIIWEVSESYGYDLNDSLEIHGFISQGYLQTDKGDYMVNTQGGTFDFQEIGINFSHNFTNDLHLGLQFISRKLGDYGSQHSKIDWAYGDYRWRDFLGVRIGKIKTPFGLYNEIRDIDMLHTSILLPSSIYSEFWRETFNSIDGLGIYGYIPIDGLGDFHYQVVAGDIELPENSGIITYIERDKFIEVSHIETKKTLAGSIMWNLPIEGLTIGTSVFFSEMEETALTTDSFLWGDLRLAMDTHYQLPDQLSKTIFNKTANQELAHMLSNGFIDLLVPDDMKRLKNTWPKESYRDYHTLDFIILSLKYQWRDLTLSAEHMDFKNNFKWYLVDHQVDLWEGKGPWHMVGYYLSGTYRLLDWFEIGAYYSVLYSNKADKEGDYFLTLNQRDSNTIPLDVRYQNVSETIREKFKLFANASFAQLAPGVTLSDEDVQNIQLIPDYELKNFQFNNYCAWHKEFVISLRADINNHWTVKLEGHFMDGITLMSYLEQPDNVTRRRFLFASKVTFNF